MSLELKAEEISEYTWDWIKTTYKIPHGNAQETGITSYLIYELFKEDSALMGTNLVLNFEHTGAREAVSGADFFLVLENEGKVYNLLVQAKRLSGPKISTSKRLPSAKISPFIKNKYSSFKHTVVHANKELYQYFLLLRYIHSSKCPEGTIPYYLFYNSCFDQLDTLVGLTTHPTTGKVDFLSDVDRNYSYSSNNQAVFGTLLTNAYDFLNLFGIIPISPDIDKINNPTFEQVLYLESTVTLQEFLRRISSTTSTMGSPGSGGSPDNTGSPGSGDGPENAGGPGSEDDSSKEGSLEHIEDAANNEWKKDIEVNKKPGHLQENEYEKFIETNSNDILRGINFEELLHKHEIKFNIEDISNPPNVENLTEDSLKQLDKLKDKPELVNTVIKVIENNYDRLPIFIVSLD
ncbi:MAG: DUF6615 family protein [Bacilli bacterium]